MNNVVYKFTEIKTGVLVEKSWSSSSADADMDYYNRTSENYAFPSYAEAADWLKSDAGKSNVQAEATA